MGRDRAISDVAGGRRGGSARPRRRGRARVLAGLRVRIPRSPISGLESDFAPAAVANSDLSPAPAAEYHMLSSQQMARAITTHEIRVVIYGRGAANRGIRWRPILLAAGYRPVERVRDATLFVVGDP